MFSALGNFLYRHRKKFIFTGVTVGGLVLLSKYAEKKLIAWQEESTRKILQQQKRKSHYERALNTTRVIMLELMPNVRKIIEKELDADRLVQAIKEQPQKKKELWKQLLPIGFGRTICSIVCIAFAAPVAHVVMMVLSSNTFNTSDETETDTSNLASPDVQARYMACFQNLIEEQISDLVARVMKIVNETFSDLSLTKELTLSQLEACLQQATLAVTSDRVGFQPEGAAYIPPTVLPWSQYFKSPDPIYGNASASKLLKDMYLTTTDILGTDDFSDVVNTLIQVGMNFVLDELAESMLFSPPTVKLGSENVRDEKQLKVNSEAAEEFEKKSPEAFEKVDAVDKEMCSNSTLEVSSSLKNSSDPSTAEPLDLNCSSLKVVKLIPILSGMIHNILPDSQQINLVPQGAPGSGLYNRIVVCSQLEALSYNVYDALMSPSS